MMLTTPAASQKQAFPLAGSLNRLSLSESHTNLVISGQLQKTLWVTFGYSQTSRNSLILAQTCRAGSREIKHRDSPSLPVRRNPLIKLNCAETKQLPNSLILSRNAQSVCREIQDEQQPDSPEHYRYSSLVVIRNGCNNENQQITGKEKGSAENTTLEMVPFLLHEENQRSPALDYKIKHDSSNLRNETNQHVRTCETFVGQPSGASLAFLRWQRLISLCATSTMALIFSPAFVPISSIRASASSALLRLDSNLFSSLSMSWRRAISPCIAVTIKPALLSPSSFTASIPSSTSCGMRAVTDCDFALLEPVAINLPSVNWCITVYIKSNYTKELICKTLAFIFNYTLSTGKAQEAKITTPRTVEAVPRRLTTNVNACNEAAMLNHTPTRFKFLFLAVHRSDLNAKPYRESVTAHSEQDARRSLAGQFVLSFAGRLPEVNHA
ncbi:hypothetical protein YE3094_00621 [Yersinia enterocolitica (type O:2) str. YE3094/96]|nr:hypothetical protein YE3094_00621 [Yersinia enterocolitica (type O:2) str. YE3094/96]